MRLLLLTLCLCLFLTPAWALESDVQHSQFSSLRLIVGDAGAPAEDGSVTVEAGLEITLADGWKTYWRSPGDAGFPLEITFGETALNVADVRFDWPYPSRFVEEWGLEVFGYKKRLLLPVTLTVTDASAMAIADLDVDYAVCSDICISEQQNVVVVIPAHYAGHAPHARQIASARADVPLANGGHDMQVTHALIREENEKGGLLAITVERAQGAFRAPELFVESDMAGLRFPKAVVEDGESGSQRVLVVPYEISLPAKTLAGQELRLTLVDGGKAIEHRLIPEQAGQTAAAVAGDMPESPASETDMTDAPTEEESGGAASLLGMLLLAVLGGIVLNVMPCVLPVLSIKLLGAVKHGGGNTREVRRSFLASVAGILVFFMVLAGLTILARQVGLAVGWGFHFQSPQFLTFLIVLILLFAANLLGWFEIRLPDWLNTRIYALGAGVSAAPRSHWTGDFATGAFAALMATPCSAPFLGTAVGFALSRGEAEIIAIFLALGVGLAVPYLLAALFPQLVTWLPRPGAWMLRVKQVMGLLMAAAAVWLLWIIAGQVGPAVSLGIVALSALLGAVLHGGGRWRFLRHTPVVAVLCLVLVTVLALLPSLRLSPYQASDAAEQSAGLWQRFERLRIAEEVAAGRVVFVDVTAEWCLTCKFNKVNVLDREPVLGALSAPDVVAMRADMTRPVPELQDYLKGYGRYGIPFNIVYGPAAPEGIPLSEILSAQDVLDALAKARGGDS